MSGNSKVIWSEGMFLRPQHFQQQERYVENLINNRCFGLRPYGWGFYQLQIDTNLFRTGKIALKACSGIFADGTPFNLPEDDDLPLPLDLEKGISNEVILLALPLRRIEAPNVDSDAEADSLSRFRSYESQVRDYHGLKGKAPVQVGKLKTKLMRQGQELSGYTCLGFMRVIEVQADKNIISDDQYIPTNLNCFSIPILNSYLKELHGLLNTRSEAVAARLASVGQGGVAEVDDFILLQMVNRYVPLFEHLSQSVGLHPELFYRYTIQMAGELATFLREDKRPVNLPSYYHDDLQTTFLPLMEHMRLLFSKDLAERAVPIPLKGPKYGTYAAKRPDLHLIESAVFILAVRAEVPTENIRRDFPRQTIIGPVEEIHQYVRSLTPGIAIRPLSVAPRQLPYHSGFIYFELEKHGEVWKKMAASGGFAIHIGSTFPGLKLEFWAIREG